MRVFVTGASGWVGSAVIPELVSAGHQVVGLARSDSSAAAVTALGAEVVRGSLDDPDGLRTAAAGADGVIHLAFRHDFSDFAGAVAADARAIEALGAGLEGTGRPLVVTAGTPAVAGTVATEADRLDVTGPLGGRESNSDAALALATRGVRSSVVRLPRSVHGKGDAHGFVARLAAIAREQGVAGYVGDGTARWPAVHVADAAVLYRLAVEAAPAGSVLHAVGDEGIAVRDIAAALGERLDVPAGVLPAETFGFLGAMLGIDQPASAATTRDLLGWAPTRPGLLDDIAAGYYTS